MKKSEEPVTRILGLGFDNEDGHVRITRGKNFDIFLGSDATHERMQEICIKLNEKLARNGKDLKGLSRQELIDLISDGA
jgi:hypothetical protein